MTSIPVGWTRGQSALQHGKSFQESRRVILPHTDTMRFMLPHRTQIGPHDVCQLVATCQWSTGEPAPQPTYYCKPMHR